jgi:hypothetical protein
MRVFLSVQLCVAVCCLFFVPAGFTQSNSRYAGQHAGADPWPRTMIPRDLWSISLLPGLWQGPDNRTHRASRAAWRTSGDLAAAFCNVLNSLLAAPQSCCPSWGAGLMLRWPGAGPRPCMEPFAHSRPAGNAAEQPC